MPIKVYLQGAALVLLAALGFSLQPLFAREVYADGANALGLVWLRFLVPSLLLLLILPRKTRRLRPGAGFLGMINGLASLCYFVALQQVSVSLTVMLLSLFPLLVFLQAWARRQESLSAVRLLALAGALAGIYCTLDGDFAGSWAGILFGFGAALFYSAYLVGAPRWMPAGDALGSSAWTLIGAALVFSVPAVLGYADLPQGAWGWSAVLALGILSTFIPFLLLIKGIGLLQRQFDVAIFSTLEPVASVFWAWLLLHETLSENSILGGVLVLGAALLMIWSQSRVPSVKPALAG
ncbi:DMT family transporter [Marinobacterium rhizophilum]|uniref:EamA family transporter n=1 Tax=Marinobacterium rhizophilum TaxID=420402 RepID=A0ABY5HEY5_9GAMM|nr:DMT family transporter [Marinobacterium rhizophilum]UTW10793.1 EamA family transporter [Marinobacterium rhizophilum]